MNVTTQASYVKNNSLLMIVIGCNVLGNFSLSHGMRQVGQTVELSPLPYLAALLNPWVATGVCVLMIWLISQLSLLSRVDLSYVLPVTSVSYVLAAVLGAVFQREQVSPMRWLGILAISFGVLLVGRTTARTTSEPAAGAP